MARPQPATTTISRLIFQVTLPGRLARGPTGAGARAQPRDGARVNLCSRTTSCRHPLNFKIQSSLCQTSIRILPSYPLLFLDRMPHRRHRKDQCPVQPHASHSPPRWPRVWPVCRPRPNPNSRFPRGRSGWRPGRRPRTGPIPPATRPRSRCSTCAFRVRRRAARVDQIVPPDRAGPICGDAAVRLRFVERVRQRRPVTFDDVFVGLQAAAGAVVAGHQPAA